MKTWMDLGIDIRGHGTGEMQTTCPECSSTRKKKTVKCLSVNLDKEVFICHHCGWKGSLAEGADRIKTAHWHKPKYVRPEPKPKADLPEKVREYFHGRGITDEVLIRNQVWYGSVYMPQIEDYANAIGFPYFRDGELVNQKYRDGRKNFRMEAGAERILYGLDDIGDTVVIVEGEIDKLSLEVAGYKSCLSVPDGAPSAKAKDYSSKFDFLESAEEKLSQVKKFVIAVDSDQPGQRLEDELSRRLGRERCLKVSWPSDSKDANEVLIRHGKASLADYIASASPYPVEGTFKAGDLSGRIVNLYENGWEKGIGTGWHSLDQFYTVRPGEFSVVTGIPNSGKSNWLDDLTINLAKKHGWRIAVFSPENQPLEDHMARQIEKWAQEPFSDGPTQRISPADRDTGMNWLDQHFTWILPDEDWSLDNILSKAKELVFREGIRGLVVDPWNELEHTRPSNMSETEYVSFALRSIRQFARKYGVHVWIVAHPAKLYKDNDGNYPIPTPYDISGSAHWRNKADNCITVWRDFTDDNPEIEIHVQKIRFRQIGRIGMCRLIYQPSCCNYREGYSRSFA